MRLYRVLTDEEFFGNLPVAHTGCDQVEDFQLPGRHSKLTQFSFIQDKGRGGWNRYLFEDHDLFLPS
jgi:hypothetical protein